MLPPLLQSPPDPLAQEEALIAVGISSTTAPPYPGGSSRPDLIARTTIIRARVAGASP
jgi:hypothetical protein